MLLVVIYCSVIIFGDSFFWNDDLFGLGMIFRLIFAFITHTIIGFIFALYKSFKLRKDEKST